MADTFTFELVSPEKLLISAEIVSVILPGFEGEMTVMAHHAPTMSIIKPGIVTVQTVEGTLSKYVVFGGFIDITPSTCTLLAESALTVDALKTDDLDTRISVAHEAAKSAVGDADRMRLSTFVSQLEELKAQIPA